MNNGAISVRRLSAQDWPAIQRIHDAARLQELKNSGIDPRAFCSLAERREHVLTSPGCVACSGNHVVGFVTWWVDGYITLLYVDPSAQRQGIGRQLLDAALHSVGDQAWTTAIASNEGAIRLYESVGMKVIWTRPRECEGYPYQSVRLALPTSRMSDAASIRFPGSLS